MLLPRLTTFFGSIFAKTRDVIDMRSLDNWLPSRAIEEGSKGAKALNGAKWLESGLNVAGKVATGVSFGVSAYEQWQKDSHNPSIGDGEKVTRAVTKGWRYVLQADGPALRRARSSVGASAVQSEWLSVVLLVGSLGLAWGRWPPTASIIFSMDYSIDEVDDISPAFRFRIPHTCVCRPRQGAPPMRSKPSALSVAISAVSTSSTVGVAGAISHWRDCAVEQRSV